MMLVILASAQLKAPGRYPSFDLQSQTLLAAPNTVKV